MAKLKNCYMVIGQCQCGSTACAHHWFFIGKPDESGVYTPSVYEDEGRAMFAAIVARRQHPVSARVALVGLA